MANSATSPAFSRIEEREKPVAKFIVEDAFEKLCGKKPPSITGYYVGIRIYQRAITKTVKREDGTEAEMYTGTERTQAEDKYQSMVGLVVAMGPQAYKGTDQFGNRRFEGEPWCNIGDFVLFPRYEGLQVTFRDVPLLIVPDDKIIGIVDDPEDVIATHLKDR